MSTGKDQHLENMNIIQDKKGQGIITGVNKPFMIDRLPDLSL